MRALLFVVFLFSGFATLAQIDFNDYKPLKSSGVAPYDFTEETFRKVNQESQNRRNEIGNQFDQREFLIQSRYSIDDLLHSGTVVYGDEISNYITEVASKVLKSRTDILDHLRFYTIKSNIANAFSTDQGIIFVTTGLISRLENEAQLAYILAHEISHYTEQHVVKSFVWQKQKEFNNRWIRQMSIYSQDKELEADRLAVAMYMSAGYSKDELYSTFDVLSFAHLPFEQKSISLNYFETDKMILNPMLAPDSVYSVQTHESEEDSLSSHPNTSKRKEEVKKAISSFNKEGGDKRYLLDEERFQLIRKIARFESVRLSVMNADYVGSIYTIYLIEQESLGSLYLERMKAQTWLGLYRYYKLGQINSVLIPEEYYEGDLASVFQMIENFSVNNKGIRTIALRTIYDLYSENKSDSEINSIYHSFLADLRKDDGFILDEYSEEMYLEGEELDSIGDMDCFTYAISDLIKNGQFKSDLSGENLSTSSSTTSIDTIISLEPRVISYSKQGLDLIRSEQLEQRFSDAIDIGSKKANIELIQINSRVFSDTDNNTFNERSLIYSYLTQIGNNEDIVPFPVDYSQVNEMKTKYGTSKVMFNVVLHTYDPDIKWGIVIASAWLAPTFPIVVPIYLPQRILAGNRTDMLVLIIDIESGELIFNQMQHYNESLSKYGLGARMYDMFTDLKPNLKN